MRKKIEINRYLNTSIKEVYTSFVISKTSLGVSETTLNSYKYQFRTISKYIDIEKPISDLSKRDVDMTKQVKSKADDDFADLIGLWYNTHTYILETLTILFRLLYIEKETILRNKGGL